MALPGECRALSARFQSGVNGVAQDGGYHVYAPALPGLHTQGNGIDDAMANASEAVALYADEGLREDGRSLDMGVMRRRISLLVRDRPDGEGSADG